MKGFLIGLGTVMDFLFDLSVSWLFCSTTTFCFKVKFIEESSDCREIKDCFNDALIIDNRVGIWEGSFSSCSVSFFCKKSKKCKCEKL